jgi:hypothetical protein
VLDSLNAVLAMQEDVVAARQLLRSLISSLRKMGLTVVLTVETPGDPGGTLSRYGVEEFVADNVVLLRNVREGSYRRRTLEVLKMRGAMHHKGDVGFTVVPGQGLVVLPITAPAPEPQTGSERVSSGNAGLDRLTTAACCGARAPCCRADGHRQDAADDAVRRRGAAAGRAGARRRLRGDARAGPCQRPGPRPRLRRLRGAGAAPRRVALPGGRLARRPPVEIRDLVERLQPTAWSSTACPRSTAGLAQGYRDSSSRSRRSSRPSGSPR